MAAKKSAPAPVSADDYAGYIDQGQEVVSGDSLAQVRSLAISLMDAERRVSTAQEALDKEQAILTRIREHDLPDLMTQYELPELKFKDESSGATMCVKVGTEMRVSLPKDNRTLGHAWLRKMKLASIIKTDVVIPVGRDAKSLPKKINAAIKKIDKGLKGQYVEKVEPATLKAKIIEMLTAGTKVPLDIFSIYSQTVANVSVD